ncbi:hypothetical protein IE53DRAFT_105935 [Violaceomyces palustris]|uniref:Uncharacterized protein n=1 Tax=Violaceomyces palustris TaxID=1673888 RepID=A0ACD0NWN3_9BASI|nr:hypothetical protein IE53DRAFT_105935 [Violaceomyces palustris]
MMTLCLHALLSSSLNRSLNRSSLCCRRRCRCVDFVSAFELFLPFFFFFSFIFEKMLYYPPSSRQFFFTSLAKVRVSREACLAEPRIKTIIDHHLSVIALLVWRRGLEELAIDPTQ